MTRAVVGSARAYGCACVAVVAVVAVGAVVGAATGCTAQRTSTAIDEVKHTKTEPVGPLAPASVEGHIDENGGTFSTLYFAVVGDTRPDAPDLTEAYPVGLITRIYEDIASLQPAPLFVVSTGDYMFATNGSLAGAKQMGLYTKASSLWKGYLFAAMGNHECNTITSTNCVVPTTNMNAFVDALVRPLRKEKPYYTVFLREDDDPGLTTKLIVTACNAWSPEQKRFLEETLQNETTTYTILVRHEPGGDTSAPCVLDEDALIAKHHVDLLISGHVHTFERRKNEIIVGNGGAPPTSSQPYGFATVELVPGRGFRVVQYDGATNAPITSFILSDVPSSDSELRAFDEGAFERVRGERVRGGRVRGGAFEEGAFDQGAFDQGAFEEGAFDEGAFDQGALIRARSIRAR